MATRSAPRTRPQQTQPTDADQRVHPRVERELPVRISQTAGKGKTQKTSFEAAVSSKNISIGGVYLTSSFFLKMGVQLRIEFDLPVGDQKVACIGEVVHVIDEGMARRAGQPTGFAIRFDGFEGDSEIYLRAFLAPGDVYDFVEDFASRELKKFSSRDRRKLVEMIVRWEMLQEALKR